MKTTLTLVFLMAAVIGCKSTGAKSASAAPADFPCNCGTPEAAFDACLQPLCAQGKNNPANPACACGTITIGVQ